MNMLPRFIFFLGLIAAAAAAAYEVVNYPDPSIPCGAELGLCPRPDLYCKPDDTECADLTRCPGACAYKNTFVYCGGFRLPGPEPCEGEEGGRCLDDPRNPESCGMACDGPGICLSEDATECHDDGDCPSGQWCYEDGKGQTGHAKVCM
ncbi:hypothetical protein NLU13_8361 [Sarocladium strictum]|uniref:Uncharacterized protein n=1 Tax=Sarocladium strictum TaxID=5046 RepID=A0AA39L4X0_SARSR|nr:hypothetical protein NLU13_8361 [Sarocladium strictum]